MRESLLSALQKNGKVMIVLEVMHVYIHWLKYNMHLWNIIPTLVSEPDSQPKGYGSLVPRLPPHLLARCMSTFDLTYAPIVGYLCRYYHAGCA